MGRTKYIVQGLPLYRKSNYYSKYILNIKFWTTILGPATPIFFILSPGVNPLKDVEALGKKLGYTQMDKNFHNVSLGQGQEIVAEYAMNTAASEGHWVILQVKVTFSQ